MLGIFTGTFISLIVEKLLIIYFTSISFYYDFMFFSCKNLFYITMLETAFGWFSYEHIFADEFLILKSLKLTLSYELFLDDFIIIFENVELKNKCDYWQFINQIFRTHGKRFMLFKEYRNNLIINALKLSIINITLVFITTAIEICALITFFYWLSYLVIILINKKIVLKFKEYTIYLKGISYGYLYKPKHQYPNNLNFLLICLFIISFNYYKIYSLFDTYIYFIVFSYIIINFYIFYSKFFIIYNFYFSFMSIFAFNLFFKKIRLNIKTFFIKLNIYFLFLLSQIGYLFKTEMSSEININNNFFQELLLKFFLIIAQHL